MFRAWWLLPLLVAGCGSSGNLFEPPRYPSARIAAREVTVELHDARRRVQPTREFDTPLVSAPGELEGRELALHPQARAALERRMKRLLGTATARVLVRVTVREGEAGWRANWIAETAFARVTLAVQVFDDRSRRMLLSGTGRANAEISSLDVADEESAELFDRVVVRAFEEVITQPEFVTLINAGLSAVQQLPAGTLTQLRFERVR